MNAEQIKFVSPKFLAGAPAGKPNEVCLTPEVDQMLATESVVAISVSGGKDSEAVALAVARHLERVGHNGPKVLIHADLGRSCVAKRLLRWTPKPAISRILAVLPTSIKRFPRDV